MKLQPKYLVVFADFDIVVVVDVVVVVNIDIVVNVVVVIVVAVILHSVRERASII